MKVSEFVRDQVQFEPIYRRVLMALGHTLHYKASDLVTDTVLSEVRNANEDDMEATEWQMLLENAASKCAARWAEAARAFSER